jgi:Domain of unknown function (DUF929)
MSRKPPRPNRATPPRSREPQAAERARQAELAARLARARRRRNVVGLAAGVILVVLAALVIYRISGPGGGGVSGSPVPQTVLDGLNGVPAERFGAVGRGGITTLPTPIRAAALRGENNLPRIVYIGAEYCPYCAAERWPLIVALNRFGSFTGLKLARSASDDVYPSTPTFTFYGATYTSQHLAFDAVETATSQRSGNGYQPLETMTAEQQQLLSQYDAPPYVAAQSAGAIPFLDFANQYALVGSTYDTGTLQGKTWEEIAQSLADPNSAQAKGIIGSANIITAAICQATGDNPVSVCGQPEVKAIETDLAKAPVPR